MTDIVILAELAPKTAVGEEDRPATTPTAQAVFLSVVGKITAYAGKPAYFTDSQPAGQPVLMALTRADLTACQPFHGLTNPLLQLSAAIQTQVGRLKVPGVDREFRVRAHK
jgi:hypothetical protein